MKKVVVENNLEHKPKKSSKKILLIGFVLLALVIMACHFFRFPPLIKAKAELMYEVKVCACNRKIPYLRSRFANCKFGVLPTLL